MREPGRVEFIPDTARQRDIRVDVCVVGAGAAGVTAAVEAGRLGLSVCLVDALPQIGGQSVNGLIGTLCGFYSMGAEPYQLTYGFASDVLGELGSADALSYRRGRDSIIALYDDSELASIYARHLLASRATVVLGAILVSVDHDGSRIKRLCAQTRYGPVAVAATTYIDASGDAMVSALAGAPLQRAAVPVYGTSMFSITNVSQPIPARSAVIKRLEQVADQYGLQRRDGFVFEFPARNICLVNLTHFQTPLDAVEMTARALEARGTIDRVMSFLRSEFAEAFAKARVNAIGQPGIRQTTSIVARRSLQTSEVRAGRRPDDAIGRCAWPIEFHGSAEGVYWEEFVSDHITWIPLGAMISRDISNLIAAGRCVDAEPFALAAIRVIGPCMAMGAAAAAAAAVGGNDLHALRPARVQDIVSDNVDRQERFSGVIA
ncbi:FAD-dependent oxidoreductase [Tardiphaga sp. 71_E8_N1_1]|uniref:FAD-dependent oxidoreductase n=1 Tax=Tardiphaga sp. 71_E8_N1_1 TaxID=3240784 RepID=UPI003F8B6421